MAGGSITLAGVVLLVALGAGACAKDGELPVTGPPPPPGKELDSGEIMPGLDYTHQFTTAGTFPYECVYHAAMVGTVWVTPAASNSLLTVPVPGSSSPFPPESVKVNGVITWHNGTGMHHTVTSTP